ncbi:MAG: SiaB family protein kinase [Alphaproteobacteria bacterium]|uniref:SiaB family protein kinase n=1 Tax=Candidatus Nitrobium versatile TaxID=2884831 RepID=A0A953M195_9BACT|nr:SiaB family protein kinase [Candidatus Nitrobium versatile]
MESLDLFDLRKSFTEKGIMICFIGPFSHSIIEELGKAVKRYLESEEATKSVITDIFAVFVEQTQNVRNYTARCAFTETGNPELSSGILVIGKSGDKFTISSGNVVENKDIDTLTGKLEHLNRLDKQQLKALYKEQIRARTSEGHPGAGLGLIDIARRASEPLSYSVRVVDDSCCFFSLTATI